MYQMSPSGSFGLMRSVCGYEPRRAGASALEVMVNFFVFRSSFAISPEVHRVNHMLPSLPSSIECGPRYLPGNR